jgi:Holliday junction resolvasome RuvABC endonuclease subunit
MNIEVGMLDPSFTHFGVVRALLDLDTLKFTILRMETIVTEPAKKDIRKVVRKNSTQLGRCKIILKGYIPVIEGCRIVFAEIPTGAQSANAAWSFGAATMAVAACPVPVIQVQPTETKMAAVGTKTASKEEMIEWAVATYPDAAWAREERKGKNHGRLLNSNEHVADALAVGHAGILTDQFQQLLPLWRQALAA